MPRDLFGDVSHPSISVGSRKWYTVPLSLAAHVSVIVSIVLVSLAAQEFLPLPREIVTYVGTIDPPDPPPAPRAPDARVERPQPDRNAAPLHAPAGITPDPTIDTLPSTELPGIDVGAVPGGDSVVSDAPPIPPPPPEAAKPVRAGTQVKWPTKIRDAQPIYSTIAQTARVQGTVVLEAVIGIDGRVQNVRVLRSVPLLDQAALDAVRQWEYTPSQLNGVPVPVIMTVTVTFKLNQ
jgi:periplasmic protein TonB